MTYLLAKYLAQKLRPFVYLTESYVKESTLFFNELKDIRFDTKDIFVIFDMVSLYINTPMNEAMEVINRIMDLDTNKLVEIV